MQVGWLLHSSTALGRASVSTGAQPSDSLCHPSPADMAPVMQLKERYEAMPAACYC
jgi:hypothetical protein